MPSISIHEKVGYEIGKIIGFHTYDYYLGLLAPDAPNLNGFASKEERWKAHQRKKDYYEWRESLDQFFLKEKNNYPREFIIGYYIHILTDIVYDEFLYLKVRKMIIKDYSLEEAHDIMREDMNHYYFMELDSIWNLLRSDDSSYDILNISKEQLLLWSKKQISFNSNNNSCKYITNDIINSLIEIVKKELLARFNF